jgi:DNA-binding Lrp family transcriptional regulator
MRDIADSLGNARLINRLNKIKVVNLIRNNDSVSRADVARESGLSVPTVSRIVEDLMAEGLVREIGEGPSQKGRRPLMLRFSVQDHFIIGIDLRMTQIYGVLSDFDARIIREIRRLTPVREEFLSVIAETSQIIEELRSYAGVLGKRIHGIGVAVAGLINRDKNIVELSPDVHWRNVDIGSVLSQKNDTPVIFDNFTRVMALGEMLYGIGKEHEDFICVNVGCGIGAAFVLMDYVPGNIIHENRTTCLAPTCPRIRPRRGKRNGSSGPGISWITAIPT